MFNDLSFLDCMSKFQVEIVSIILLLLGQKFIRSSYLHKRKQTSNLDNQNKNDQLNESENFNDENDENQKISNCQTIRLLNKYVKLGQIEQAEEIFNTIQTPCIQSYTMMIKGYSKINQLCKSTKILNNMMRYGFEPSIITYNTYLACVLKCKDLKLANETMEKMKEKDIITYSTLIRGLLSMKLNEQAMCIHDFVMKQKNLVLDEMYFNVLINGLVKNKQISLALSIYSQMEKYNFEFNDFSLSVLIQLISKLDQYQIKNFLINYSRNIKQINRIINQMLIQNQTIFQASELLKETIKQKIILKNQVYENCISVMYQIITHQIIKDGITVSYAQEIIFQIISYTKKNKIHIQNQNKCEIIKLFQNNKTNFRKKTNNF